MKFTLKVFPYTEEVRNFFVDILEIPDGETLHSLCACIDNRNPKNPLFSSKMGTTLNVGVALFEDGRKFWTVTKRVPSKGNDPVTRTHVFGKSGQHMFVGKRDAPGTLHHMEERRLNKIVKSVMLS